VSGKESNDSGEEVTHYLPHTPSVHLDPAQLDRKKVLIACLFSLLTTQTLFLNVENILPTYIPDEHPKLDSMKVAFILRYAMLALINE
jgi:hypothetical protein